MVLRAYLYLERVRGSVRSRASGTCLHANVHTWGRARALTPLEAYRGLNESGVRPEYQRCLRRGRLYEVRHRHLSTTRRRRLQPPPPPPLPHRAVALVCQSLCLVSSVPASPAAPPPSSQQNPSAVVLVPRYGFNRDGLGSFDVRGPPAPQQVPPRTGVWQAGCIAVTPALARRHEGELPGCQLAVCTLQQRCSPACGRDHSGGAVLRCPPPTAPTQRCGPADLW